MRLLALVPPGTNARSIYCDVLRGVQRAGHHVFAEDIASFVATYQQRAQAGGERGAKGAADTASLYARHLESLVRTLGCDAMITLAADAIMALPWGQRRNGTGAASFAESIGTPVIHYWLDAPFWAYGGQLLPMLDRDRLAAPWHVHIINNEGTAQEMREVLGFSSVIAQPYGVDEATFRPWPSDRDFELAICTGPGDAGPTPVMLEELKRDEPDIARIRQSQADAVRGALADALASGPAAMATGQAKSLAAAWLAEQVRDPDRPMRDKLRAATADRAVSQALCSNAAQWAALTAMVRTVDSWQRAFITSYLSRSFRSLLMGAGAAALTKAGWPLTGEQTGFLAYHEMAVCYSRAAAAVSVMRYQDDVGLNPKGLEIAASGAVAVQRWRSGAQSQLGPSEEGLWFKSPAEAREQIRPLVANPARRDRIAAAGRARILREHTWMARGAEMIVRVESMLRETGTRA